RSRGGGGGARRRTRCRRRAASPPTPKRCATSTTCAAPPMRRCTVPRKRGATELKRRGRATRFAPGGRQVSTGLMRVSLRAEVVSHLAKQLALFNCQH